MAELPSTQLKLATKIIAKGLLLMAEGLQDYTGNDPNRERKVRITKRLCNSLSSYSEFYKEMMHCK